MKRFVVALTLAGALLLSLSGCSLFTQKAPSAPSSPLIKVSPGEPGYPRFRDDLDYESLEEAVAQSLLYYSRLPKDRTFLFGQNRYSLGAMVRSAMELLYLIQYRPDGETLDQIIRENFDVYRSLGRDGEGGVLFTGYYEAQLYGARERSEVFRYPVLAKPENLVTINLNRFPGVKVSGKKHLVGRITEKGEVIPYYSRIQMGGSEARNLTPHATALAWVDDSVDLFFLEIQGSGVISLNDGTQMRVQYQGKNGHPYRSIGRYLIQKGEMTREEVSMQSIRRWLQEHPNRRQEVFNYNPSLVFFREGVSGPLGCYGAPVTAGRSIATDRRVFPAGAIAFIETEKPDQQGLDEIRWKSFGRFVLNQDTGGAIKGAGRVDLFTGYGPDAEFVAGQMKQNGSLFFLIRKAR
ncbi:MAG: MltA domain-containing protein [Desulfobacterales bacterium]|nr:MltA domain-containing protein [Desulfobacterales bacterium]